MSDRIYRFFLDNDIEGTVQVEEPKGATDLEITLTREDVGDRGTGGFFGLNAIFAEQELSFYAEGRDYLLNIESTQGIDSEVRIDIDISPDGGKTYQDFFDGIVNMESLEDAKSDEGRLLSVNIEQGGFYQRFLKRKSIPYDLNSTVDLNGNTRETIDAHTVRMFSQPIRKQFKGDANITSAGITNLPVGPATTVYGQPSYEIVSIDELVEMTQPSTALLTSTPTETLYTIRDNTARQEHRFSIQGLSSFIITNGGGANINQIDLQWYVQRNSDTPVAIGPGGTFVPGTPSGTFNLNYNLPESATIASNSLDDEFRVYLQIDINSGLDTKNASVTFDHELTISVDTLDVDSNVQTFKIHEAFNKVLNGIMEQDGSLYSEVLGNTATSIQSYADDGCASFFAVTAGNQLRGKSLNDYPFAPSFDDLWTGINPIYNLGLEPDFANSRIVITTKDQLFQTGSPVMQMANINNMQRYIANEFYFNQAQVGYTKWKSEDFNSDADFNTKHTYSTRFETIGDSFDEMSSFLTGGYAIENTRRLRENSKDWKLDEDNFLIALNRVDGGSPASSMDEAEKNELFPDVNEIDFPESTYNLRLSPARSLLRWGNIVNAGLTLYPGSLYRFQSGEGNVLLETRISGNCPGSFDNQLLLENQDIEWDYTQSPAATEQEPLFSPIWREFDYPLTLEQFLELKDGSTGGISNRRLSIEVSRTAGNFIEVFIWSLSFNPLTGLGQFKTIDAN